MVGTSFATGVFLVGFAYPHLVCRVLCAGAVLQLSALHGDDLPRVSPRSGLPALPHLYGTHRVADADDGSVDSLLGSRTALDLHFVPGGQSLALQRSELRPVHAVRTPGGRQAGTMDPARDLRIVSAIVCNSAGELQHRAFDRPAFCVAESASFVEHEAPHPPFYTVRR